MDEIRSLNREYLQRAWTESLETYGELAYEYESPTTAKEFEQAKSVQVPLLLRDTVIGEITLDIDRDSLTEEERRFYITKGVLYSMGLHGTSFTNRESFFYRDDKLNQELSDLALEAIRLLYGGRLKTGMDLEETRKTLGLTT